MSGHLGYDKPSKPVLTGMGRAGNRRARDRDGSFEPQIVKERQRGEGVRVVAVAAVFLGDGSELGVAVGVRLRPVCSGHHCGEDSTPEDELVGVPPGAGSPRDEPLQMWAGPFS